MILLSLCSMCLYAAGVTLNDVRDRDRDAVERPHRPIPSGRVSERSAALLVLFLMLAGVTLGGIVSMDHLLTAGMLVIAIVFYDVFAKKTWLASPAMGLCRALNLTLGMTALGHSITAEHLLPIAAMWLYITSVTAFARTEARQSDRRRLEIATIGASLAVVSLAGLYTILPNPSWHFLVPVAGLSITIALVGARAAKTGAPRDVQRAVTTMIVLLVALDACIATAGQGLLAGTIVALFLIPVIGLGRRFRTT